MTVPQQQDAPLELFVPGRLCLFGEHSDWAGAMRKYNHEIVPGRTIVVGTEQGLYARVAPLAEPVLRLRSTKNDGSTLEQEYALDADLLAKEAQRGGFWSYAAGTAYRLLVDFGVGGLSVDNYRTTLPLKKGLSSSAALCVLVARAFNRVYGLKLTTRGEMQYAFEGERMTPSQCGKMDQACAFGSTPVLMTYDGDVLSVRSAAVAASLHLVLVDLAASKDTVVILEQLQAAFPHPTTPEQHACVELLGSINADITRRAVGCMAAGDVEQLGKLMSEAQQAFTARAAPLCPSQLTSPVLHAVLAHPAIQPLIFGGKGVGSQGDGTAQLLCRGAAAQADVCRIIEADFPGMSCMPFTVPPTPGAAPAAGAAPGTAAAQAAAASGCSGAASVLGMGEALEGLGAAVMAQHRELHAAQQQQEVEQAPALAAVAGA